MRNGLLLVIGLMFGTVLLVLGGCGGKSSDGATQVRGPSISGFSPQSGAPGTQVTISGANFSATAAENVVKFKEVLASSIVSATTTQVVAVVPATASSGPISVATTAGTAYSTNSFSVLPVAVTPPAAPANVVATSGNTQVTITWNSVANADSYNIYWSTSAGVTKASGNKINNATSPYVQTGLTNGTPIYYVVTAVNSAGESADSAEASATPVVAIPSAPTGVSALSANAQNTISWNDSFGATSYNLYWATATGVTQLSGTQIMGVTSPYTHSALTNGQPYFYVVTAANGAGESVDSAEVSATPVAPVVPPDAPANVQAVAGNTQISLTWDAVAGASSYNIYWSTSNGVTKANGTQIASVTSPYAHTSLMNGVAYYYVVTAVNGNGESVDSSQASAIPAATTNVWSTGPAMSISHVGGVAGVISNRLHVVGGSTGTGTLGTGSTTTMELYSPIGDFWQVMDKSSALTSRAAASAAVIDGKLYVAGGCINSDCRIGLVNTLEVFDLATNSWSTLAPMPTARFNAAAGVINGRLYLAGGGIACPPCGSLDVVESYDPVTNTWRSEPVMPLALGNTAGAVINGIFYVAGGYNWANGTISNALVAFDPLANAWTTKANMPTARQTAGSAISLNGLLYVIGGSGATAVTDAVEAYDPVANLWTSLAVMPVAKWGISLGVLNGRIHVTGGIDNSNTFQTGMDIYQP